jgi:hypothetical protein
MRDFFVFGERARPFRTLEGCNDSWRFGNVTVPQSQAYEERTVHITHAQAYGIAPVAGVHISVYA